MGHSIPTSDLRQQDVGALQFAGLASGEVKAGRAKAGNYPGSFSIAGGPNSAPSAVLAAVAFDARGVPEPSAFLLLGAGLAGFAAALKAGKNTLPVETIEWDFESRRGMRLAHSVA